MQLMFILVGWHYVKQGYGVLSVLSARRGIYFTALPAQRLAGVLLCHLDLCLDHPLAERTEFEMDGVGYWAAGFGHWPIRIMAVIFVLTGVFVLALLARKFIAARRWPPLTAPGGYFATLLERGQAQAKQGVAATALPGPAMPLPVRHRR